MQVMRNSFATGQPLDLAAVDKIAAEPGVDAEKTNVYYFTARLLMIEGRKDAAIVYLKRAAAFNSSRLARALAAQQLRALGIAVPKPGQDPPS
jgi:ferritin-like protein